MKVYMEDSTFCETTVNNFSCRKLGELKNGEEKTFQIPNESARIFVISDKLSTDFCNETYQIPAGEEDIYLTGKNKFNPAAGNAFRFDGVEAEETMRGRKKGARNGIIVLCVAFVIGLISGVHN